MTEQAQEFKYKEYGPRLKEHGAVISQGEFLTDFSSEAKRVKPGSEIFTMAMVFAPDSYGQAIFDIFDSVPANMRDQVKRTLIFDDYSRFVGLDLRLIEFDKFLPWRKDEAVNAQHDFDRFVDGFRLNGVNVNIINEITSKKNQIFPFTGRTHIKGSFVENGLDSVFYIQTANFEDAPRDDIYIKTTGETARNLIDVFKIINSDNPPDQNQEYQISDNMVLYYDAGIKGESIIVDTANELISDPTTVNVQNITLINPDAIAEALNEAWNRGAEIDVTSTLFYAGGISINIENIFLALDLKSQLNSKLRGDKFNITQDPYNWAHAKCLIVKQIKEGKLIKRAFIGSSNLSQDGVNAGTREWQILISDEVIVAALERRLADFKHTASYDKTMYPELNTKINELKLKLTGKI